MSSLNVSPIFKEVTSVVGGQVFSTMYFGRHCGRNILIVQHDVTLMLIFKNDDLSWTPEFTKSISSKGVTIKGVQTVGNENVILLLDDTGVLWRLINAFEFSSEQDECLYLLDENCFYEWVPFKKFKLEKVLAVTAWKCGFACIGIHKNSERKLIFLPTADSYIVKDYTFDEVRSSHSPSFYLTSAEVSAGPAYRRNFKAAEETLVLTDRSTGKTYLCSDNGESTLINYSNNHLVSILHFEEEKCLLLCFQSGKLVFYFLNSSSTDCIAYLPKKINLIEKCCCFDSCLLWSDGIYLHHTKVVFQSDEAFAKLIHLKLKSNIESPISFVKLQKEILAVTINDIYYLVKAGFDAGEKVQREPEELLSEICEGSLKVHELNEKIDEISYFLSCKEILGRGDIKEKVEMSLEGNHIVIKFGMKVSLRKEFWRVWVMRSGVSKKFVKMADLETDVNDGMVVRVENPWGDKIKMKVSLIGTFNGENLFVGLGEVGESKAVDNELSKHLQQILIKRKTFLK